MLSINDTIVQLKVKQPANIEKGFLLYLFLVINPWIEVFGLSLHSYLIVLLLLLDFYRPTKFIIGFGDSNTILKLRLASFGIFIAALVSLILAPKPHIEVFFEQDAKILLQLAVWLMTMVFTVRYVMQISSRILLKIIFFASVSLIILYFITGLILAQKIMLNNTFSYYLVFLNPFSFLFLYKYKNRILAIFFSMVSFIAIFIVGSRTGSAILFIQFFLFLLFILKNRFGAIFSILFAFCMIVFAVYFANDENIRYNVGGVVEQYSPRVGGIIKDYDKIDYMDRSWMIRKVMVEKALKAFDQFPFSGLGFNRFSKYDIQVETFGKLQSSGKLSTKRSSHNSYLQWLAELGILGAIPLIILIFTIIKTPLKRIIYEGINVFLYTTTISAVSVLIYMYVISGLFGGYIWTAFGIIVGLSLKQDK